MERTRISAGGSGIVALLRFVPVAFVIGSLVVLFTISERMVGAVMLAASLGLVAVSEWLARRIGEVVHVAYDDRCLYVETRSGNHQIALEEIRSLEKTRTKINDRNLWSVSFESDAPHTFLFYPLQTLWNPSFREFLKHLERVNPSAIDGGTTSAARTGRPR